MNFYGKLKMSIRSQPTLKVRPVILAPSFPPSDPVSKPLAAVKSISEKLSDPTYIGPGMWVAIHTLAKNATTYEKKKAFIDFMTTLRLMFPCPKCRMHLSDYLDKHPFDTYWSWRDPATSTEMGMFRYAWEFHNAVNIRLNKPIVEFETAKTLYYDTDNGVCSLECDSAH